LSILSNIAIRYPKLFCNGLTRVEDRVKTLYLTFDDGPNMKVTNTVLDILRKYNAKASFFCKGSNAVMYPKVFQQIFDDGHTIGNHSFSHLNAFKVSGKVWIKDVLAQSPVRDSYFFRPPYGRIYPWQCKRLKRFYQIVLWDVLTYDFREDITVKKIKKIIKKKVREGSIIVFHDTILAAPRMLPALEWMLEHYTKKGYKFERL